MSIPPRRHRLSRTWAVPIGTFRLAAKTWLALQASDVPPSPRKFELWFTHLEGTNPELSRRMDEIL